MKHIAMLLLSVFALSLLPAQDMMPWQYLRHSDLCSGGNVFFRFDTIPATPTEFSFYTSINGTAWEEQDLSDLSLGIKQAYTPYQAGQHMRYRVRAVEEYMSESMVTLNPAYLSADAFPLALNTMAFVAEDALGDTVMINVPALDLTGSFGAVSDNKLYVTLDNATGTFPTLSTLTAYNLYMVGIINPESALGDSIMYAMVYTFNIPGVISTGLYKIGMTEDMEPTFQRLGNTQSQVSGGKLYLACSFSDLTADPSFGDWPNQTNSLLITSMTIRIALDLGSMIPEFFIADYTNPALFICHNNVYQRSFATPPNLLDVTVTDMGGSKLIQALYSDPNQDFPLVMEVTLSNGNTYPMLTAVPDFSEPTLWSVMVPAGGWTSGFISFSDNDISTYEYPITTSVIDMEATVLPITCHLPNPVTGAIKITLENLQSDLLSVSVFNLRGQKVREIHNAPVSKGNLEIAWDGRINGSRPSSGIYFLRVRQGSRQITHKFMLIR